MRKLVNTIMAGLTSLLTTHANAQTSTLQTTTHEDSLYKAGYLLPDFEEGTVLMKSGSMENARLNYNTNNQTISFMNGGQYMELTGLETVDTVFIGEKKFIPYHEKFYIVVNTITSMPLLALVYNKHIAQSATIEHNGLETRNSREVSNNATGVYSNRNYQSHYELTYQKKFFLQNGKVLLKASSQQDIINLYPDKKEAIKTFVKENKTNFYKDTDVVALLVTLK